MLNFLNKKLHTPTWLFVLLLIVFVLRIPSFFEPYSYGDEMIYLTLGEAIRRGIPLYKGIHDNKPPLLYLLAAVAGNLFWFKAILAGWSLITIFIFWKLTEVVFPKRQKAQMIATSIFALLTTIPLLEGNIINSELFMIGPIILGFLILITRKNNVKNLLVSGFLFSIAALFKIPAAFDLPAIVVYWLITEKDLNKKSFVEIFKKTMILAVGFLTPIFVTFVWFYFAGALKEYFIAAFAQNFGYLSSFRPGDIQKPFLIKNGPLLIRAAIVLATSLILFRFRKKLSKEFVLSSLWIFFSLFAVTLSERPYPHYLIQMTAPLSLLLAMFFTKQNMEQLYTIIPLFFAFLVPVYYNFWYYPTVPYYKNFVNLVSGKISKDQYLNTYGSQVPRNYQISNFLVSSTTRSDKVFVLGDGVPIYALSRRLPPGKYVADYHIKDFSSEEQTISIMETDLPAFIVIQPGYNISLAMDNLIRKNYGLTKEVDGAQIWRLLNPKVRSLFSY